MRYAFFREPDIGDEYTALATEIVYDHRRSLFRHLQLLKEKNSENQMEEKTSV